MRKIRKWKKEFPRIFAVALAAAMLFNMPGTAAYAEQAAADMETPEMETSAAAEPGEDDGGERIPETAADDEKEPETDGENPEEKVPEEETTPPGEDEKNCDCGILCTEDAVNAGCPVCGAEGADLSACRGEEKDNNTSDTGSDREDDADTEKCICELLCTEDSINDGCPVCGTEGADLSVCEGTACKGVEDEEEDTETIKPEDAEAEDTDLCAHHKEHTEDCGYIPVSEDGEGSQCQQSWHCAYECRICPIEELIAVLPDKVTEDNAKEVRAQLDEILALYGKLTEEEQEQVDISRCMELQEELDAANIPAPAEGEVSVGYQKAEWNGSEVVYSDETADCIPVTDSTGAATWNAGWYVVNDSVNIDQPITVSGAVNLILADGCTLNAEQGIVVTENNSLTIYAQAGGTGTLNAIGVYDSYKASAGIGGSAESPNSGAVTIHGGVIHATGGGQSGINSAAGIGGGAVYDGEGGNSGEITIYGGTVTADCGQGDATGAGIGGGASLLGSGGNGSNITIYGGTVTAASHSDTGGAGIGGGAGGKGNGGAGSNIRIYDGTVNATGGKYGAGIGGGSSTINKTSGAGSDITISGGLVTAVGGQYAAGIGGGGGFIGGYNNISKIYGGTGTGISITGGIVDAQGGAGNNSGEYAGDPIGNGGNAQSSAGVTKTTGIVFENGAGFVYGDVTFTGTYAVPASYTLTIPIGASLSGSGTLTGGSAYLIEGLSADMIFVPEGWHYTKDDMSEDIKKQVGLNGDVTICGQTFKADTDGWELSVTKESDLKYIVKYTHTDGIVVSKDVILTRAQTTLSGVAVYKADGTTPANTFGADETFIVKATPEISANAIRKAAAFTAPSEKQMALFVGDTQVSEPVGAGADGVYTMTVKASDVLDLGNVKPNGDLITLTVKFVGNGNMEDAAGTVAVNITAEAEVNGTLYPTLKKVFEDVKSGTLTNDVAITLLRDIDLTGQLSVGRSSVNASTPEIRITLELNGKTISAPETALYVSDSRMTLTIQDSSADQTGSIRGGSNSYIGTGVYLNYGTLDLTGGNFLGSMYGVVVYRQAASAPTLEVSGDAVIQGTGQDSYGLRVSGSYGSVNIRLSGGTFTGGHRAIDAGNGNTLKNLLAEGQGNVRYAYFDGDTPTTKDLNASSSSYKPITVKPCTHVGEGICEYQSSANALTHSKTCLACGMVWAAEDCKYTFEDNIGTCGDCRSTITLSLQDADNLTYNGTAKEPGVILSRGEDTVTEGYSVAYRNNIDAGDNTATVTVTIGSNQGTYTETFSIGRATPAITWNSASQTVNYTGSAAEITAPTVALVNGETYNGEISYSYTGASSGAGLPTDAGTYTIKASIAEQGNYTAAETANTMTLTINRASGTLTVPENSVSKTFGDEEFSLRCTTNGDGKITYVSSNKDVATVSADGNVLITGVGETVITATLAEGTNHTGGARQEITITVAKASAPSIMGETRNYTYTNGSSGTVTIDVAGKFPKDRGETKYTVTTADGKGILADVSVDGNGNLVYTVLGNKSEGDTASITVTAEMANYETAAFTVDIELVKKKAVEPQAGGSVSIDGSGILVYGQRLAELKLADVVFVEQGDGRKVEGNLTWKDGSFVPKVQTTEAEWIFTPADSDEYVEMIGTVPITVIKATPDVETPVAQACVYDPSGKLGSVALSGGSATWTVGGSTETVEGTWGWQSADTVPTVDNSGYAVIFTPKDTANYETVTRTVTVRVTKAAPYIAGPPKASEITYGDALSASVLSGGTVQYGDGKGQAGSEPGSGQAVQGTFTWKTPATRPTVADSDSTEYEVLFTPSDTVNYETARCSVKLAVKKAPYAPNRPGSAMSVSNSTAKVGDVSLPEGWEWQEADRETALEVSVPVTALAVYVGADKDNYENTETAVTITRASCDHTAGDILYTGKGEKAPTCTESGLGHRECTKCGSVMESGIAVDALGHTGGTATCSKRKVCTRCGEAYGDTDGRRHGDTEIRGFVAATCTAGGYTGDTYCRDCGTKTGSGTATPASGHDYRSEVTKEPTTGSEGTRTYTCTRCGNRYTESIPKLPEETHRHSYTVSVVKQPTCADAGIESYTCACGDSYMEPIAALGHHYLGSETRKPTTTAEGIMTYTCSRCGHSYTRAIAKLPGDERPDEPGNSGTDGPGNGSTEESRPDTGLPFIKGEDGRVGWDVIRAEEEQAAEGSTIHIDMNGTTVVPGDIFDSIKGRDITITFDMGDGILWSVDGKSITTDRAGDIDFSVKTGVNAIPVDIINNVTGERYSIQISLAYEGEFGFTAVLSIGLGKENAGYTVSLYYYNKSTGDLEFICKDTVAQDGTVLLSFTHASDYVIAIDGDEEESGDTTEPVQPETSDADNDGTAEKSPQTGQAWKPWWFFVIGVLVVIMGIGVFFMMRRKKEGQDYLE